jgi:hypothetical protein
MTELDKTETKNQMEPKLPRRDWILLPLLSLVTIALLFGSTELIARRMFYGLNTGVANCMIWNDVSTGPRGIPNSVCWDKAWEGKPIEYRFNSCGHRAGMECGPKPPGTYRIVVGGSSYALGYGVPIEKTFATLLPVKLSQITGRRIELYNEGRAGGGTTVSLSFEAARAASPDLILWILTPFDIRDAAQAGKHVEAPINKEFMGATRDRVRQALATKSIPDAALDILDTLHEVLVTSRTVYMLRHYLFESQRLYLDACLLSGEEAGFLKETLNAEWQNRLRHFDGQAARIEKQATGAGIPLVAVLVPYRAQASVISMGEWPAGFNPYKLDDELRAIITSHGGTYVDILPGFRDVPNAEQYYLPLDGHPTAEGHAVIAGLLAKALTSGAVPELRAPTVLQTDAQPGR